ncbi:MAG: aldo/keto reductase [Marinilabiliales bacterium]|nr:aldo/keto reductase [Marinilabiliales bacterium]
MNPEDVIPACEDSLKMLGLDYVDMYVVHWPWPNFHVPGSAGDAKNDHAVPYIHESFMKVWERMTELKKSGKARKHRNIQSDAQKLWNSCYAIPDEFNRPVYNQMELHPLFQQQDLVKFFIDNKIVPSGYMALGSPDVRDVTVLQNTRPICNIP